MKMELKYFLHARFVRVIKKAKMPPNRMDTMQVPMASSTVFRSGVQRFFFAILLVKRST